MLEEEDEGGAASELPATSAAGRRGRGRGAGTAASARGEEEAEAHGAMAPSAETSGDWHAGEVELHRGKGVGRGVLGDAGERERVGVSVRRSGGSCGATGMIPIQIWIDGGSGGGCPRVRSGWGIWRRGVGRRLGRPG